MEVKEFVFVSLLHTSFDKVALCKWCQVSFAYNLVLTAENSPNALKDSMHAIMESYEVTPHKYQYFRNTFIIKLCNPLAKVSPADVVVVRIHQQA